MRIKVLLVIAMIATAAFARQESAPTPVKTVEITSTVTEAEVGQQLKLTVVAKDASGKTVDVKPAVWFAAPFDVVSADSTGTISFFNPGEARIGAVVAGKVGSVLIRVKPAAVTSIDLPSKNMVVVGAAMYVATAVSKVLRLWLLRQLVESQSQADQIAAALRDRA